MVDYRSDEALQEIHDEMYREEGEKPRGGISTLSPQSRTMVGVFVAIVALMTYLGKLTIKNAAIILIAGGIILYFLKGFEPKKTELTWLECMIRINDLLKFLQRHPIGDAPQVPKGEVHIKPIGRKHWYDGKSFKRSFAVDLYDQDSDLTEMYFVEIDVFTGDIITFRSAPEGVYGDETKDVRILPSKDQFLDKKRDQFLNKSNRI